LTLACFTALALYSIPRLFFVLPFQPILIFHYISEFFNLLAGSVLLGLPFLLGYLLIGTILVGSIEKIGFYYAINLLGSAFGGVLFTLILIRYPFATQFRILSVLLLFPLFIGAGKKYKLVAFITSFFIILMPAYQTTPSDFKGVSTARNVPAYATVLEKPTPYGFFTVLSSNLYRGIPGLSLNFSGKIRGQYLLFQDGNTLARLPLESSIEELRYLEYLPSTLPYLLKRPKRILYLFTEGGQSWLKGPYFKAEEITVPVGNAYILDIVRMILERTKHYGATSSSLHLSSDAGRNLLKKSKKRFDLVEMGITDSGTYRGGMRSNHILTAEGLHSCIEALSAKGVLSITTAIQNPPRVVPRMLNLLVEVGKSIDLDMARHLLIYRGWNTATFLFFAEELSEDVIKKSLLFLDKCSFDPVYFPGITKDLVNRNNKVQDPVYYTFALQSLEGAETITDQGGYLDFSVPTDKRPFFYYFNPLFKAMSLFRNNKDLALNLITLDEMMLFLTFLISLILGLVFLIFPAAGLVFGQRKEIPLFGILYFLSIGFGFLFIEILLIQKLNRFTGDYLISFIIILTGILVSAGIGSWLLTPFVVQAKRFIQVSFLFLFIFYLPLYLLLDSGSLSTTHPVLFFVLAGGLGLMMSACMGIYFPAGMKLVQRRGNLSPAWMWAFNGLASVIAPSAETVIVLRSGFHSIFIISIILYLVAALIYLIVGKKQ
jgi:hypothetical protein